MLTRLWKSYAYWAHSRVNAHNTQVCMDETADVLLAYKMNGKELSPDHGYPIRLIVPGYIGGRMVRRERERERERESRRRGESSPLFLRRFKLLRYLSLSDKYCSRLPRTLHYSTAANTI